MNPNFVIFTFINLISIVLSIYFFFSLFGGERGFISYKAKKNFYEKLIYDKKQIQIKI